MLASIKFSPIYFSDNCGHGEARRASLSACNNELVALMDADDISLPTRFEKQLSAFASSPALDVVGGQITEFTDTVNNAVARRVVPENDIEIKKYAKKRCPMNQVSVMLKKSSYDKAGGYKDWYCEEDYYLWLRMIQNNCRFANVPDDLVYVRVGDEMSSRRGGVRYFLSEESLQRYMLKNRLISLPRYIYNTVLRFGGEVILSTCFRTRLFKLFRSKPDTNRLNENVMSDAFVELEKNIYPPFSVAMCVYGKDNPEWFDIALNSILEQTVKPNEIVLVVDGPIPDTLQSVIDKYSRILGGWVTFKVIYFALNKGLGITLRAAVENCSYDLIARMDSDDIAVKNRFEQQLRFFEKNDKLDIVGGDITEFISDEQNIVGRRTVPKTDSDIKEYIKKRCPLNHVTVMFKKSAVMKAGGYVDWHYNEDYYLWIRMLLNKCSFANTGTILVNVRVGKEMYSRRGGLKYFKSEARLQKYMLDNKIISLPRYLLNITERLILQVLIPSSLRGWIFRKFARQ